MITLTLPLPPKELSPNARVPWYVKSRAIKAYRYEVAIEALRQAPLRWMSPPVEGPGVLPPITADVEFWHATNRKRDEDNLRASLKTLWDGLVDARFLPGDDMSVFRLGKLECYSVKDVQPIIGVRKPEPAVIVRLYHAGETR